MKSIKKIIKIVILVIGIVFALLIAFRYMLDTEDFIIFKRKLTQLFNTFTKATSQSQRDKLLKAMHFPPNWSSITRYKLC